ncbi:hypothetical protein [Desulfomicrobium escambiense]|uniref:hypothetical protein n=1 Tax=Desulfomicrobium escambiense TaxID=29503 RepID=UPI00041536DB|nr:hypothetical protein [Desulfomicrobium escambiense]
MYCKKCKFHSFDHVAACPKCGADWEETRKALYLNWITASGVSWVAPVAAQAAPAASAVSPAMAMDVSGGEDELSHLIAPAPTPPSSKDADIDVSLFAELDFSAEGPEAKPSAPAAAKPAPKPDEDLFLDSMPVEDMPELDFSASFDAPAEPAPPISKPKREDLFIPELEEMLAPLTEEPRQNPAPAKKAPVADETEILLDFGDGSSTGTAAEDVPFLTLDDTIKPS